MKLVPLTLAAIAVLVAMVAVSAVTGVSQEAFEIVRAADVYASDLQASATPLRALFALDTAFLVLYSLALVMFAQRLVTPQARVVLGVAIGALLGTALLDMIEDHFILGLLRGVERGAPVTAGEIQLEHVVSQVKFHLSYLAQVAIGLHVPTRTRAGRVLAWLLTVGTLVQGAWLYVAPDGALALGNVGRWVGFLVGFALIIQLVRDPRAGDAAATGAPA